LKTNDIGPTLRQRREAKGGSSSKRLISEYKTIMALTLKIENQTSLPDGGPLTMTIQGQRGIDIGRDQHLDWTLPDPSRAISGKHCEVRWRDNAYWLHDTSTNGTFIYGTDIRLNGPHRIRNGDRFVIGDYIVLAILDDERAELRANTASAVKPSYDEIWNAVGDVAPAINPKQLKLHREVRPAKADFLDWAVDVPSSRPASPAPRPQVSPSRPADHVSPARVSGKPPPAWPEVDAMPTPRPAAWPIEAPKDVWGSQAPGLEGGGRVSTETSPPPAEDTSARADPDRSPPVGRPRSTSNRDLGTDHLVRAFARGAGLPANALSGREPSQLAEDIGQLIRILTENVRDMLQGRQQSKRQARSSDQTTMEALNNNPLKFAPTPEDALRIMFGPPTPTYLDARRAFAQGFDNLKTHQIKTYSAMQHALDAMLAEFDPRAIEKISQWRSAFDLFESRKARLWELYVARWNARAEGGENALLNAFMNHFIEHYDHDTKR